MLILRWREVNLQEAGHEFIAGRYCPWSRCIRSNFRRLHPLFSKWLLHATASMARAKRSFSLPFDTSDGWQSKKVGPAFAYSATSVSSRSVPKGSYMTPIITEIRMKIAFVQCVHRMFSPPRSTGGSHILGEKYCYGIFCCKNFSTFLWKKWRIFFDNP